jgi:UDP-N-acetylmuramyl tripeptide synthase
LVTGTNGKTSTAKFLSEALVQAGETVITNRTGANLLNGLVSSALCRLPLLSKGKKPVGVFEVDEYALSEVAQFFLPEAILFLNVFRDQLDRYGEVNNILQRWKKTLKLLGKTKLIYLGSDPALFYAFRQLQNPKFPFVIPKELLSQSPQSVYGDLVYCPVCGAKLHYSGYYLGHLGAWECQKCEIKVPKPAWQLKRKPRFEALPEYGQINLLGVNTLLHSLNYSEASFWAALNKWQPAFGRGEIYQQNGKEYHFYLGKNPASWTAALNEITKTKVNNQILVLGLNNRVPDGHDVSWIYDAVCQIAPKQFFKVVFFGDRGFDLAVRFKLANIEHNKVFPSPKALKQYLDGQGCKKVSILANYSSLLEIRQLIVGKALI